MSQDRLIPTSPTGEENPEEIQQLQVEDEENTKEIQ